MKLFITATDTEAGKTYVTVGLLKAFNCLNFSTLGIKPVATGCVKHEDNVLYNADALLLQQHSSVLVDYADVNPFAFIPPVSPNIAAKKNGQLLTVDALTQKIQLIFHQHPAQIYLIEGIGGWQVPLNDHETMADFVSANRFSVLLVVNIKLGCLNHALLTYQSIRQAGVNLQGFIANCCVPGTAESGEIINTLKNFLHVPCLGVIAFQQALKEAIDISVLTGSV